MQSFTIVVKGTIERNCIVKIIDVTFFPFDE